MAITGVGFSLLGDGLTDFLRAKGEIAVWKRSRSSRWRICRYRFQGKAETVYAVNGVSFAINEKETFGLVGESGCGKSQTCRAILHLIKQPGRVTGGSIRYRGEDILSLPEREMRRVRGREISVIFQEPMTSLNPGDGKSASKIYEVFDGNEPDRSGKRAPRH